MKYAILVSMLAGSVMGQHVVTYTNIPDVSFWTNAYRPVPAFIDYTNNVIITDAIISNAIANGTVCRVRGEHEWKRDDAVFVGLYEVEPSKRTCKICGRKQSRVEKWEDEQ